MTPQMNRRDSLKLMLQGIGLFTILPGAGRVWKAQRKVEALCWIQTGIEHRCFDSSYMVVFHDFLLDEDRKADLWRNERFYIEL